MTCPTGKIVANLIDFAHLNGDIFEFNDQTIDKFKLLLSALYKNQPV